ncbi:SCO1/SenC family protein [Anaeromyxobacter sp. K]|uniref:SCO family protein n=1 Tax=Anaeromyxobacter sp. (strain K) TaxID=447217 RepID=UPI00015F8972|nr:SCO family protein [Anaeromyxobacter sp. K]ACG72086.1 SCO1/SenC family protein [Anaeromyxobacter sp. K]
MTRAMLRRAGAGLALAAAAALAAPAPAAAQFWRQREGGAGPSPDVPPVALEDVRVEEKLGAAVPLDVSFTDWKGQPFSLRQAFDGKKPVVVALVYYDCPMLCGLILSGMGKAMRENGLELGRDYQAVTISFDPEEGPALAAERRRGYLQSMGRSDAGTDWPFLVGTAEASRQVSDAVGFYYKKDPASGEWAHQAAIFVITPDGKVSRYLYGIDYPPKDFRLSVVEAASGKVGTSFDRLLLTCYRYDPASRKYEPYAFGIVRAGAAVVLVALTGLIAALVWRERRAKARQTA